MLARKEPELAGDLARILKSDAKVFVNNLSTCTDEALVGLKEVVKTLEKSKQMSPRLEDLLQKFLCGKNCKPKILNEVLEDFLQYQHIKGSDSLIRYMAVNNTYGYQFEGKVVAYIQKNIKSLNIEEIEIVASKAYGEKQQIDILAKYSDGKRVLIDAKHVYNVDADVAGFPSRMNERFVSQAKRYLNELRTGNTKYEKEVERLLQQGKTVEHAPPYYSHIEYWFPDSGRVNTLACQKELAEEAVRLRLMTKEQSAEEVWNIIKIRQEVRGYFY